MGLHKPKWFSPDFVMVSTARTCGLTKGGRLLPKVDRSTGQRIKVRDPETDELTDAIDDELLADMEALRGDGKTDTLTYVPRVNVSLRNAVPVYYDDRYARTFRKAMLGADFNGFSSATLGDLRASGHLEIRGGHGSPSHDQRVGDVPYIKVSDLRAGLVNINPTNRVPLSVARAFWKGDSSGLKAYDLLCPERTSKNIGDFCVLMPGQERVVTTKEIIVLRPGPAADFDSFFLLWAMTLRIVRDQWRRIVFMQTNREDVGKRFLEIEIPIAADREAAARVSDPFRRYYGSLSLARAELRRYLHISGAHHFFVAGADDIEAVSGLSDERASS